MPSLETAREVPLHMDAAEFRRVGYALVDAVADFLPSLPGRPVTRAVSPDEVQALLHASAPLPEDGTDAATLLARATRLLFEHSLFNGHPRFYGYITSSPAQSACSATCWPPP
jgi:hypothetical protein